MLCAPQPTSLAEAKRLGAGLKDGEVGHTTYEIESVSVQNVRSLHSSGKLRFIGVRASDGHAMQVTLRSENTDASGRDCSETSNGGKKEAAVLAGDVISVCGQIERRKRVSMLASSLTLVERSVGAPVDFMHIATDIFYRGL
jgi:hypothetical protein